MKNYALALMCLLFVLDQSRAADFNNITFDNPDLSNLTELHLSPPPQTFQVGTATDLFPGWTAELNYQTYAGQIVFRENRRHVPVLLVNHNSTTGFGYSPYFNPIITDGHGGEELRFSLSQVGTVPSGASELITKGK